MRVTSAWNWKDLARKEPATPPPMITNLLLAASVSCVCLFRSVFWITGVVDIQKITFCKIYIYRERERERERNFVRGFGRRRVKGILFNGQTVIGD
jgi:hypothetical protein